MGFNQVGDFPCVIVSGPEAMLLAAPGLGFGADFIRNVRGVGYRVPTGR